MRGTASVPVRLNRLMKHRSDSLSEREIARMAEEYGLHPNEIRREAEELLQRNQRYGPEPLVDLIHRLAVELDIPVAELEEDARRIAERGRWP